MSNKYGLPFWHLITKTGFISTPSQYLQYGKVYYVDDTLCYYHHWENDTNTYPDNLNEYTLGKYSFCAKGEFFLESSDHLNTVGQIYADKNTRPLKLLFSQ